jgi:hypothetical protein
MAAALCTLRYRQGPVVVWLPVDLPDATKPGTPVFTTSLT